MPTTKLGQLSSNAVGDLQQDHFDMNQKIHEMLSPVNLDSKRRFVRKMPALLDEIRAEIESEDRNASPQE